MTIISRETIEDRARAAHEAGQDRGSHGFNWHASALQTWQAEWDRCEAVAKADRELCGVGA